MRAALDTNVIVSGLLTVHGVCARIIDRMLAEDFQLCVDGRILTEYATVLERPKFGIPFGIRHDFLEFARYRSVNVNAAPLAAGLPDETDLPFLEVALEADAILVTGNTRHFPRKACKGVAVVSPREFLDLLKRLAS